VRLDPLRDHWMPLTAYGIRLRSERRRRLVRYIDDLAAEVEALPASDHRLLRFRQLEQAIANLDDFDRRTP
jgi:hemolysin activation/secretion protein